VGCSLSPTCPNPLHMGSLSRAGGKATRVSHDRSGLRRTPKTGRGLICLPRVSERLCRSSLARHVPLLRVIPPARGEHYRFRVLLDRCLMSCCRSGGHILSTASTGTLGGQAS
jgi:hypothetical protein